MAKKIDKAVQHIMERQDVYEAFIYETVHRRLEDDF